MDNRSLIITCGCGDTNDYAKSGWKIHGGDKELPPIVVLTHDNRPLIELLLDFFPFATKQAIDLDQPFAFSVEIRKRYTSYDTESGEWSDDTEFEVFDLLNGAII